MPDVLIEGEPREIWIDLLRDLARAADRAAVRLSSLEVEEDEVDDVEIRSRWGRKFMRLPGLGLERGLTTKAISTAAELNDEPNAEKVLVQLEKNEHLERVPGAAPKRWRLTREQRRNRILQVSRLVPEGQWTTYGDIAIAVSGSVNAARAVSRVAAKNPTFANPHRVLEKAGTIPAGWEDDDGKGPEECARRLETEGIRLKDGRAPSERRISHDELRLRLENSEAAAASAGTP